MLNQDETPQLTPEVNDNDYRSGPDTAPVTLVEYGDFECPDCGRAFPIVEEVRRHMGDRLRFVYRHFPLEQHPHAEHAAEAAEAAGTQGKFWEMYAYLFQHQQALSDHDLLHAAQELGLDTERFKRDMTDGVYLQDVEDDAASGDQSGVKGTPTFFINNEPYFGPHDLQTLQQVLEEEADQHS